MSLKRKAGNNLPSSQDPKKAKNSSITSFFGQPKPVHNANSSNNTAPVTKFDKDAWVAGLTEEQKTLLQLEIDTLDVSWLKELKDEVLTKDFLDLKRFLKRELEAGKTIFPKMEDVYSWSTHTPLHTVKAVIIGQDPYHNVNQAHGLCFSVLPPTPAPPSLKNIYKALKNDYPSFTPPPKNGGLLTPWADRGVLLLNTCLTVRAHDANSHANRGWEKFTQKVIDTVAAKRSKGVVFLAWGSPAGKRVVKVNREKHLVLQSVHPSPLSASRGWFDCGHFKKTNEWLEGRYGVGSGIEWDLSGLTRRETTEEIREKAEREEAESRRVDEEIIGKLNEETRVKEEEKRRERERKEVEDKKKKEVEDTLAAMEAIEKAEEDDSEIEI